MGRHQSGKPNYAVSSNAIIALLVVVALLVAAVWWFFLRSDDNQPVAADQECTEGELTLPVAEERPGIADQLIAGFTDSEPVVGGHCVTPEITDDISRAAVYVSATDPAGAAQEAGRTTTGEPAAIQVPVGVATADGDAEPAAEDVAYPAASHEDTAVLAATALTETPEDAARLLQRDSGLTLDDAVSDAAPAVAVPENELPEGYEFTPLDAAVEYTAVALEPTDGVSEEQVNSGDALVSFARDNSGGVDDNAVSTAEADAVREAFRGGAGAGSTAEESATAAPGGSATPTSTQAPAEQPQEPAPGEGDSQAAEAVPGRPVDTLFLLDTSAQMNSDFGDRSRFEAGADAIAQVAPRLGETGRASALWNYSSPLNPGVTEGYRANLGFGRGTDVANSVQLLGTGGHPQTREAVAAALQTAADRASQFDQPVQVMLFTSGTDATMSDEQFQTVLDKIPANVHLTAFHLGGGEPDPVLNATPVGNYRELENAVNQALGL